MLARVIEDDSYRPGSRCRKCNGRSSEARPIRTHELQYELPSGLIAQKPCEPRDASRLMVVNRQTGAISHQIFRELPAYLNPRDVMVLNRTRVLPAKFTARRTTGGRIEGLFVRERSPGQWEVMLSGVRRVKPDEELNLIRRDAAAATFGPEKEAESKAISTDAGWTLKLVRRLDRGLCHVQVNPADPAEAVLGVIGAMPLPPYIHRNDSIEAATDALDRERYQTVFAAETGAVAAPTAGLHFTTALLDQIREMGVAIANGVLHVGLGTFQPVEVEELSDHPMHREWYELKADAAALIADRRADGGRIVAIGTTSVRVLETCAKHGRISGGSGWTDLLIYPPYEFRSTDVLLTNFHLPGSTLLALVYAFGGTDLMRRAYAAAIEARYRFFSYGDAMLIL